MVLRAIPVELKQVAVIASPRLNETPQPALDKKRKADNIVSVMSGEEIRALPNANAAEAAARIPGVSAERDEGDPVALASTLLVRAEPGGQRILVYLNHNDIAALLAAG